MSVKLAPAQDDIGRFCQRHRVRRLTRLHEPVRAGSAAAFLVEFIPEDIPPLATLAAMEAEITEILGQPTDLHLHIRGFCTGDIPPHGKIAYDRARYMEFNIPRDEIARLCEKHYITRLATIKYPRRDSLIADGDLDFIAEFAPDSMFKVDRLGLVDELNELLGYPVDLLEVDSIAAWQEKAKRRGNSAAVQYERPY